MISRLRGILLEKRTDYAVVDVGGVGYGLTIPISAFPHLPDLGKEVRLFTYTHVREDVLALFGFLEETDRKLFEHLITVNGVGPRLAVTILSGLPAPELLDAIRAGDGQRLQRIPGIGRKTGERIILELREKLGALEAPEKAAGTPGGAIDKEVVSALINLGCTPAAADKAVDLARRKGAPAEFEPLFRMALELVRS
ncbi:MAG: Holliday junction branch migration protein RuvA [Acidobacteria bacterium]|nr:Holliday junction branch migration protein RuvA [Acidobacteriota bacterium]